MRVAVVLTVHNRSRLTRRCLDSLFVAMNCCNHISDYHIYLVDDGSTDKTRSMLREFERNELTVINGSGELFWAGGMRKGMREVMSDTNVTHIALVNNDVVFSEDSFNVTIDDYTKREDCIIVGAFQNESNNNISYGLRDEKLNLVGLNCKGIYPNGNFIFFSRASLLLCGALSQKYVHGYADFEFGYRATKYGLTLFSSSKYLGRCEGRTNEIEDWMNFTKPLNERVLNFRSPTGFGITDYKSFLKDTGKCYYLNLLNVYLKVLFPRIWR